LEATAYQTKEVLDAIQADSNVKLKALKVDGGGIANQLLMQFQADIVNVSVVKPVVMETTSIGAAFAAGLAVGVWKDLDEIRRLWAVAKTFEPNMSEEDRVQTWTGWKKAVSKSLGWVLNDDETSETAVDYDTDGNVFEDAIEDFEESHWVRAKSTATSLVVLTIVAGLAAAGGFLLAERRRK
jgi:hypothetical protein